MICCGGFRIRCHLTALADSIGLLPHVDGASLHIT
jgi:hypothetical protein